MKLGWLLGGLLCSAGLQSQNTIGLPRIINYTKTDFHGGTQTWDIKQDSSGRLYFANNEGLLTYDGTFWKDYALPNKTIMRSLAVDEGGRIYAGGQGELGYFAPGKQGFLTYTSLVSRLPADQRSIADIWDIEVVGSAIFFRALDRIIEWNNGQARVFKARSEWVWLKKMGNRLFAQDVVQGLFEWRESQWQPVVGNKLLQYKPINGMLPAGADSILMLTVRDGGFWLVKDSIREAQAFPKTFFPSDINAVVSLNEREFMVGTGSSGAFVLDFQGKRIQQLGRKEGLQNNNILSALLDRDGNLWTGLNNGISFIAYNAAVKYIHPNVENELAGFGARILKDRLFLGSSDGAFEVQLDPGMSDLSFSRGSFRLIPGSSGQVWRLDEVNKQILMAHNNGTYILKPELAERIALEPAWIFQPLSAVLPSEEILVGNYTGLKRLRFSDGKFINEGNLTGLYESLRFLAIDNDGGIWASHPYRGIYKIEISGDRTRYETRLYTSKDGLPSDLGNHVFRVQNRVLFATEKGAFEFDKSSGRFKKSAFLGSVLGEMELRYLKEDTEGNVWFVSGKRMGAVMRGGGRRDGGKERGEGFSAPVFFPELTGQVLSGFEQVYPYDSRNIFIASEKGLIHFNLEKYRANRSPLTVQLGQVRAIGRSDSILYAGFGNWTEPRLHSQFSSFRFEFSSPYYGLPNTIEYSYMLEGFDADWSEWSIRTEKDYTNLTSGDYIFKVKARTNLGRESEHIAYKFSVSPPWYKSMYAYLLYTGLGILLIAAIVRWQRYKLHQQRLKFEEKQRQLEILHQLEIEQSEKAIIQLQNEKLEHEVRYKNKELADAALHLVERTDALARVKEELQKLYKSSDNDNSLKKALQLVNDIERNNENWDRFAARFDEINDDFLKKIKGLYPQLTSTDLKLCAYLQLNMSSKEIAQLMNISLRGVEISRYRLRKKLQLPTEKTFPEFFSSL
ncbi:triple tyrosine motif-containing protein [Flavihumibacter sp. UBA7668]|uniref:triple tyrosine motif-containing protein n=1 Tax=Flavihumibacter sp. UBA7668 TaxID=1946542 RepID=UPI0025C52D95|nr:triple tyrosine motif-containing protein [Flavihumibacter sp. UBA7668]